MLTLLSEDITLAICPGICNSSESIYIRRVVYHAQFQGFRVAVLNHVGALKNVVVTSPRIFNYGESNMELPRGKRDYGPFVVEVFGEDCAFESF